MNRRLPRILIALAALAPLARADSSPPAPAPATPTASAVFRATETPAVNERKGFERCGQPNGLWVIGRDERATGQRLPVERMTLASVANGNDAYQLMAITRGSREWKATLCVGGVAYPANSWGSSPNEGSIGFRLDRAQADRVAVALHIERHDRRPLGQELVWRFVAPPQVGEDSHVPVAWEVENRGAETLFFDTGGAYRGSGRDNRFAFTVTRDGRPVPDAGTSMNFGGLGTRREVKPGARVRVEESLERWAAVTPGRYEIQARFSTGLHRGASEMDGTRSDLEWDVAPSATAEMLVGPR
jgi:hypothetical protein